MKKNTIKKTMLALLMGVGTAQAGLFSNFVANTAEYTAEKGLEQLCNQYSPSTLSNLNANVFPAAHDGHYGVAIRCYAIPLAAGILALTLAHKIDANDATLLFDKDGFKSLADIARSTAKRVLKILAVRFIATPAIAATQTLLVQPLSEALATNTELQQIGQNNDAEIGLQLIRPLGIGYAALKLSNYALDPESAAGIFISIPGRALLNVPIYTIAKSMCLDSVSQETKAEHADLAPFLETIGRDLINGAISTYII